MDKILALAIKIADNYAWIYDFKVKENIYIINSIYDEFKYTSPEDLIADWYEVMEESNKDFYETGDENDRIWGDEDIALARLIYRKHAA